MTKVTKHSYIYHNNNIRSAPNPPTLHIFSQFGIWPDPLPPSHGGIRNILSNYAFCHFEAFHVFLI